MQVLQNLFNHFISALRIVLDHVLTTKPRFLFKPSQIIILIIFENFQKSLNAQVYKALLI